MNRDPTDQPQLALFPEWRPSPIRPPALSPEDIARIEELARNPDLLSARRIVALSAFVLEQRIGEVTPEAILRRAAEIAPACGIGAGDILRARDLLLGEQQKAVGLHYKLAADAGKQERLNDLLTNRIIPAFVRVGQAVERAARLHLPPDRVDRMLADVKAEIAAAVADVAAVAAAATQAK